MKNDSDPGFPATDHALMARALRLAERGLFTTQPNPRVGCVITQGGEIAGEGQLPLLGADVVPIDRHADRHEKKKK